MDQVRTTPLIVLPCNGIVMVGLPDGSALALTEAAAIATANRLQSAAYAILGYAALKGRGADAVETTIQEQVNGGIVSFPTA